MLTLILLASPVLGMVLKSTLVLALALGAAWLLRRRSAAYRHAVWTAALAAILLLPVAALVLPSVAVPMPGVTPSDEAVLESAPAPLAAEALPRPAAPEAPSESAVPEEATPVDIAPIEAVPDAPVVSVDRLAEWAQAAPAVAGSAMRSAWAEGVARVPAPLRNVGTLLGLGWLLGMMLIGLRWGAALVGAQRLVSHAEPVTDPAWVRLADRAALDQGVRQPVRLLRSDRLAVPVAWGFGRPAVVLPSDADGWDAERRRVVLLHETAHLARYDAQTQFIGQMAVLVHWFNPLAWWAYHRMLDEREQACDDRVLARGARASSYAQHLVELARRYRPEPLAVLALAPMARPTGLESRVRAILDPHRAHGDARPALLGIGGVATLGLLAALAALTPAAPAEPDAPAPVEAVVSPSSIEVDEAVAPSGLSDWTWSGRVASGGFVEVHGINGAVRLEAGSGDRVTARAERERTGRRRTAPEEVRIVAQEYANGVVFCAVYPGQRGCASGEGPRGRASSTDVQVTFTITVPDGVDAGARITNGAIATGALGGTLSLTTTNGSITAETRRGDIEARTTNGAISARASGFVRARTTNGSLDVAMGRTAWDGSLELRTTNGAATVTLPAQASTEVAARTSTGRITSDFALDIPRSRGAGSTASGRIGSGGRTLDIRTTNGAIRLQRGGAARSEAVRPAPPAMPAPPAPPAHHAVALDTLRIAETATGAALAALEAIDVDAIAASVEAALSAIDFGGFGVTVASEVLSALGEAEFSGLSAEERAQIRSELDAARAEMEQARMEVRLAQDEVRLRMNEEREAAREQLRIEREVARAAHEAAREAARQERAARRDSL